MISLVLAAMMQAGAFAALPTAEDLAAFYPKDALAKGIGGRAVLNCGIDAQGFLANCHVDTEFPAGQGFGEAALALQGKFRMKAAADSPLRRKGGIRIPVRFMPPPADEPGVQFAKPDWRRRPTAENFADYYPDRAQRDGVGGMAVAQCTVLATGRLTDCTLVYEDPPGYGFGAAILKLTAFFEAKPLTEDGKPVSGGVVRIPIRFGMMGSP
jgi:TonB family protein